MLIIDEADRLKPKAFAEARDIFDRKGIAVVLVGAARLDAASESAGLQPFPCSTSVWQVSRG